MNESPALWRDRERLLPLLGRWRELARGRALHRVTTGGDWTSLQLRGDDRASLLLGALPAGVLVFPYTAPLPAALHAALRPIARNPLVGLLAGATVEEIALLAHDLVLHLTLASAAGPRLLRHQLFGSRGGTVVMDTDGRVLWTAHPSPHPCLLDLTAPLAVPAATAGADDLATWTTAGLLRLARQQETALGDRLQRQLERRLGAAARLVANLDADLARAAGGEAQRRDAETLASYLHLVPRGADEVTCPDPHGGPDRTIALDPAASAAVNLERLFRLARKAERGRQVIAERLAEARAVHADLSAVESELAALLAGLTPGDTVDQALARLSALQAFAARHPQLLRTARTQRPGRAAEEPARPFRRFRIGGRWEVWVGRSSRENDELTHRASSPRDLWLHAQGVEGSHVILRTGGRPEAVPRAVLERAAALAAAYSKARHSSLVPVLWTERRYVRRPRRSAPGTAVCLRAESVMVEPGIGAGVEPA